MLMSTVVLIRPGSTDFDEQNRVQGALDLPLNNRGQEQVQHLLDQLQKIPLDVVYSAPGEPARSTAEKIGEELGVPVKISEGFRNLNQGLWQGLQIDDIRRKFPKVFKQWQESPESVCPPEGETVAQAVGRVQKSLQKPLKKKKIIAIVASEPLASLIYYVITGKKPKAPGSICGGLKEQLIEFIDTEKDTPSKKTSVESDNSQALEAAIGFQIPSRGDNST